MRRPGQVEYQLDGEEPADEGADREREERQRPGRMERAEECAAEDDDERSSEGRAGGDPDQPRVGEGVAEEPLQRRARRRQAAADECAERYPRETDHPEDGTVLIGDLPGEIDPDRL